MAKKTKLTPAELRAVEREKANNVVETLKNIIDGLAVHFDMDNSKVLSKLSAGIDRRNNVVYGNIGAIANILAKLITFPAGHESEYQAVPERVREIMSGIKIDKYAFNSKLILLAENLLENKGNFPFFNDKKGEMIYGQEPYELDYEADLINFLKHFKLDYKYNSPKFDRWQHFADIEELTATKKMQAHLDAIKEAGLDDI